MQSRKVNAEFIKKNKNISHLNNLLPNLSNQELTDLLKKSGFDQLDQSVFTELFEDNSQLFKQIEFFHEKLNQNNQLLLSVLNAVEENENLENYLVINAIDDPLKTQILQFSDFIHQNPLLDAAAADQQALAKKALQFVLGQINRQLLSSLQPKHTIESDAAYAKELAKQWANEDAEHEATIDKDAELAKSLAKKWADEDTLQRDYVLAQKLQMEADAEFFLEEQKRTDAAIAEEIENAERKQQTLAEAHREQAVANHARIAAQQQAAPARNNAEPIAPNIAPLVFDAPTPAVANPQARPANAQPLSRTTQHVLDNKKQYADAFNGLSDAELIQLFEQHKAPAQTLIDAFNSEHGSIGAVLQSINEDFKDDAKLRATIMHHLLNSSKEEFERFFQKNIANQALQNNKAGLLAIHETLMFAKRPIIEDYRGDNNNVLHQFILKNRTEEKDFKTLSKPEKANIIQQEMNTFADILNASLNSNFKAAINQLQPADQEALKKELTPPKPAERKANTAVKHSETTQAVLQNKDDYKIFKHLTESELVNLLDKNNLPVVTLQNLYTEFGSVTSVMEALDDVTPTVKADILYRLLNASENEFKQFLVKNAGNAAIQSSQDSLLQLHQYLLHSKQQAELATLVDNQGRQVGKGINTQNEVTKLLLRNFKEADVAHALRDKGERQYHRDVTRLEQQLPAINKQQAQFHNILTATLNSHLKATVKALPAAEQKTFNRTHSTRSQQPVVAPTQTRTPNPSPATLTGPYAMFPAYGRRHYDNELESFFASLQNHAPINRRNEAIDLLDTLLEVMSLPPRYINEDNMFSMNIVGLNAFRTLSPRPFQVFILNNDDEQPLEEYTVRLIS